MNLNILTLHESIRFEPQENEQTVLIRIHDIDYPVKPLLHTNKFHSILDTFFSDIIREIPDEGELFTSNHAREIIQFIKDNKDADTFVVHCHGGVSRSPAVAMSISWIFDNTQMENTIINDERYYPNPYIMSVLASELGILEQKKPIINKFTWNRSNTNKTLTLRNIF